MTTNTVVNDVEKARELLSKHIKELYVYPKVAELDVLVKFLNEKNVSRDAILAVLTDFDEFNQLKTPYGVLSKYERIMPGLKVEKRLAFKELVSHHPVYSLVNGFGGVVSFVEKYILPDSKMARQKFKEEVASGLNWYFERKQKQSNLL